jgi:hypothetical protein
MEEPEALSIEDIQTIADHYYLAFETEGKIISTMEIADQIGQIMGEGVMFHEILSKLYQHLNLVVLVISS